MVKYFTFMLSRKFATFIDNDKLLLHFFLKKEISIFLAEYLYINKNCMDLDLCSFKPKVAKLQFLELIKVSLSFLNCLVFSLQFLNLNE